eukprot:968083-Alexandrium_andersonii.AAC.1
MRGWPLVGLFVPEPLRVILTHRLPNVRGQSAARCPALGGLPEVPALPAEIAAARGRVVPRTRAPTLADMGLQVRTDREEVADLLQLLGVLLAGLTRSNRGLEGKSAVTNHNEGVMPAPAE